MEFIYFFINKPNCEKDWFALAIIKNEEKSLNTQIKSDNH